MLTDLEKDILEIIKAHVGFSDAITQYEMTQIINDMGGWGTTCRNVRRIIEDLIKQGYPIISTPRNGGGYCFESNENEGLECYRRIKRTAIKLLLKARQIKANSKIKQLKLDI